MARDASGNWIPLSPVVGGTIITSTWANNMMTSFGADVTESLDRSGRGGMLVPFRIADGTKLEPGYSWTAELSTGFYRDLGGFDMRVSVGGQDTFRWNVNGAQMSLDDGVTWLQVLTTSGAGGVNPGTVQGQTLRWDQDTTQEWLATSDLIVTDAGDVGIGIAAPSRKLAVSSSQTLVTTFISSGVASAISLQDAGTTSDTAIRIQSDGDSLNFWAGSAARLYIDGATGDVGIGRTLEPHGKLQVRESSNSRVWDAGATVVASFERSAQASIDIISGSGSKGIINFGDAELETAGAFDYNHATEVMNSRSLGAITWQTGGAVERMRIDAAGNVGIGTTAPLQKLHISTASNADLGPISILLGCPTENSRTALIEKTADASGDLTFSASANNTGASDTVFKVHTELETMRLTSAGVLTMAVARIQGFFGTEANPGYTFNGDNNTGMYREGSDKLGLVTGGTQRLTIDSVGQVGIGTTTPNRPLHVVKGAGVVPTINSRTTSIFQYNTATTDSCRVMILSGNATFGALQFGDAEDEDVGTINYNHADNGMNFRTNGVSNRMTLDSDGRLIIAASTASNTLSVAGSSFVGTADGAAGVSMGAVPGLANLDFTTSIGTKVDGEIGFDTLVLQALLETVTINGNGIMTFSNLAGGGTTGASFDNTGKLSRTVSDSRLKKDVMATPYGLGLIELLNPIQYKWLDEEAGGADFYQGFIAQDIEALMPEVIHTNDADPEGMRAFDVTQLIGPMVAAIQELTARLEVLENP